MQLVLIKNRIVAHGEDFLAMGGTVINTVTCAKYENATIAECESCPSDIGSAGYEYHAGVFVPCAPYGKGNGNIMVACQNDCGLPKDSGVSLGHGLGLASYMVFAGSSDTSQISAAFGQNNENMVVGVGPALAMYGWFKGDDKATHPFANLQKMLTINDINFDVYSDVVESDAVFGFVASNEYASGKFFGLISDSYSLPYPATVQETVFEKTIAVTEDDLKEPFRISYHLNPYGAYVRLKINNVMLANADEGSDKAIDVSYQKCNWNDYGIMSSGQYAIEVVFGPKDTNRVVKCEYTLYKAKR